MNNSINFNSTVLNVNFTGSKWTSNAHKKLHVRYSTKTEEQKETAIRKSLERIFKKLGFGEKLRNSGEKKSKKKTSNVAKSIIYFKEIRKFEKNPDEYNMNEMEKHMKNISDFFDVKL